MTPRAGFEPAYPLSEEGPLPRVCVCVCVYNLASNPLQRDLSSFLLNEIIETNKMYNKPSSPPYIVLSQAPAPLSSVLIFGNQTSPSSHLQNYWLFPLIHLTVGCVSIPPF